MALALAPWSRACWPLTAEASGPRGGVPTNLVAALLLGPEKLGDQEQRAFLMSSWALGCGSHSRAQAPGFPVLSAKEPGHRLASASISFPCCPQVPLSRLEGGVLRQVKSWG